MTTVKLKEWTYEDYLALPEGGPLRYEVIDVELYMTPAPNIRHQRTIGRLYLVLGSFLAGRSLGEVFISPIDVIFSRTPLQYVEPDLVFVSNARSAIVTAQNIQGAPDLIVEVLSPGTERRDRREKHSLYERFGVPEYWVVDPEEDTVAVFRIREGKYPDPLVLGKSGSLTSPFLPGLSIPVASFFPPE